MLTLILVKIIDWVTTELKILSIYVFIYKDTFICVCVKPMHWLSHHWDKSLSMYLYIKIYTYIIYMHVYICVCAYIHMCVCVCVCVCIRRYMQLTLRQHNSWTVWVHLYKNFFPIINASVLHNLWLVVSTDVKLRIQRNQVYRGTIYMKYQL